jgi:hypothetical protein
MKRSTLWLAFAVLAVLHHDFWWWDDATLVFGFLPIGLAYHMAFSVAAACFWAIAVRYAWPSDVEQLAHDGGPSHRRAEPGSGK